MKKLIAILLPLVGFASFETTLAVLTATSAGGPLQQVPPGPLSFFWAYAPHLSIVTWGVIGATVLY